MNRMKHRWSILVLVGVIAACGGGDDDATDNDRPDAVDDNGADGADSPADASGADDAESASDSAGDGGAADDDPDSDAIVEPDDGDDADHSEDDMIVITDFDDLPGECVDLLAQFLRGIESQVAEADWGTASLDELEPLFDSIDDQSTDFDDRMAATGCDRYDIDLDDERSLEFALQLARREAPGTVGFLEFIASFADLDETVEDVVVIDDPDDGTEAGSGDCEDIKNVLLELAAEYGTITEMPVTEVTGMTELISDLTTKCTIAELEDFYNDPRLTAFLEG
jgi:hypothetical protein